MTKVNVKEAIDRLKNELVINEDESDAFRADIEAVIADHARLERVLQTSIAHMKVNVLSPQNWNTTWCAFKEALVVAEKERA